MLKKLFKKDSFGSSFEHKFCFYPSNEVAYSNRIIKNKITYNCY